MHFIFLSFPGGGGHSAPCPSVHTPMLITKLRTFQTTNILDTPKLSIVLSFLNSRSIWHLDTSKSVLWHLYKYGIKGEPKVHLTLFASRQMVVFVWHIAHGLLSSLYVQYQFIRIVHFLWLCVAVFPVTLYCMQPYNYIENTQAYILHHNYMYALLRWRPLVNSSVSYPTWHVCQL